MKRGKSNTFQRVESREMRKTAKMTKTWQSKVARFDLELTSHLNDSFNYWSESANRWFIWKICQDRHFFQKCFENFEHLNGNFKFSRSARPRYGQGTGRNSPAIFCSGPEISGFVVPRDFNRGTADFCPRPNCLVALSPGSDHGYSRDGTGISTLSRDNRPFLARPVFIFVM